MKNDDAVGATSIGKVRNGTAMHSSGAFMAKHQNRKGKGLPWWEADPAFKQLQGNIHGNSKSGRLSLDEKKHHTDQKKRNHGKPVYNKGKHNGKRKGHKTNSGKTPSHKMGQAHRLGNHKGNKDVDLKSDFNDKYRYVELIAHRQKVHHGKTNAPNTHQGQKYHKHQHLKKVDKIANKDTVHKKIDKSHKNKHAKKKNSRSRKGKNKNVKMHQSNQLVQDKTNKKQGVGNQKHHSSQNQMVGKHGGIQHKADDKMKTSKHHKMDKQSYQFINNVNPVAVAPIPSNQRAQQHHKVGKDARNKKHPMKHAGHNKKKHPKNSRKQHGDAGRRTMQNKKQQHQIRKQNRKQKQSWCQKKRRCSQASRPVCGSDGMTYQNKCHLKEAACG